MGKGEPRVKKTVRTDKKIEADQLIESGTRDPDQ